MISPRLLSHGLACVLGLCGAVAPIGAAALFAPRTLSELREDSALVVTGHVAAASPDQRHELPGRDILTLVIDRVIAGDVAGATVPLAVPAQDGPVSSSDMRYAEGTSGLWFLRVRTTPAGPVYLADTPQRFVPADKAGEILGALRDGTAEDRAKAPPRIR